ncbi:MAG: MFS transporter [Bellilinea sp.]|nr:MAG: MFS transporter [Bellilinea sp.]
MKSVFHLPPALHHRKFALLWAGMLISVAGSQMQLWALFWHIRTLSDQPVAVSGVGVARFLPILLLSLFAGLVADRHNRRRVMLVTQSLMTLTALALAGLTAFGIIRLWHIYLLTALQAAAIAFDTPARQALIPNLLPKADLPSAFSLNSIAMTTGSIVGPALSGVVIAYAGQEFTYLFNAVSYLAVIGALIAMGEVPQQAAARLTIARGIDWEAIRQGIRFILHSPIILSSMLLDFLATFFSSANTLLPFIAQDILRVGPVEYGWLAGAQSIGGILAGLALSQRSNLRRQGVILLNAVLVFGAATIVFGLSRWFWLTFLALALIGGADAVSTVLRNTIRQLQTPDALRGRMVSINQIFFMGGPQLGEIEAGLVAQAFGVPAAIITGGIGCILAVGLVTWRWPQLRRFNGDEPVLAGAASPAD